MRFAPCASRHALALCPQPEGGNGKSAYPVQTDLEAYHDRRGHISIGTLDTATFVAAGSATSRSVSGARCARPARTPTRNYDPPSDQTGYLDLAQDLRRSPASSRPAGRGERRDVRAERRPSGCVLTTRRRTRNRPRARNEAAFIARYCGDAASIQSPPLGLTATGSRKMPGRR